LHGVCEHDDYGHDEYAENSYFFKSVNAGVSFLNLIVLLTYDLVTFDESIMTLFGAVLSLILMTCYFYNSGYEKQVKDSYNPRWTLFGFGLGASLVIGQCIMAGFCAFGNVSDISSTLGYNAYRDVTSTYGTANYMKP